MKPYNWINEVLSGIGLALGIDLVQTKEILGIILIGLNILVLVISLIMKFASWFNEAKEDGKITSEEIKEGVEILKEGIEYISKELPKKGEKHDSKGKNRQD